MHGRLMTSAVLFVIYLNGALAFEIFSTTVAVGTAATTALAMLFEITGLTSIRCGWPHLVECCREPTIKFNEKGKFFTKIYDINLVKLCVTFLYCLFC